MSLLKLNLAECIGADEKYAKFVLQFTDARDRISTGAIDFPSARAPRAILEAYEQHRDASELGEVFSVANCLLHDVDAVVVVVPEGDKSIGPLLMTACCHPYHNELSRGARGSKPRMYFYETGGLDNDSVAALLHRLSLGSDGSDTAVRSWALVDAVGDPKSAQASIAVGQFRHALADSRRHDTANADALVIQSADHVHELGLLPAAILGLDCIKLLEGAADVFEHFISAPIDENIVIQFAAANRASAELGGSSSIVAWNRALLPFGLWYDSIRSEFGHSCIQRTAETLAHNLVVSRWQMDSLRVVSDETDLDQVDATWPQLSSTRVEEVLTQHRCEGRWFTEIVLSEIDTHQLGQLIQLFALSVSIETHEYDST